MNEQWLMGYSAGVDDGSTGMVNMKKFKKGKQLQDSIKVKK